MVVIEFHVPNLFGRPQFGLIATINTALGEYHCNPRKAFRRTGSELVKTDALHICRKFDTIQYFIFRLRGLTGVRSFLGLMAHGWIDASNDAF
ncbi:hypothetical protein F5B19DRAFT_468069 [Rostrohypoxylon terebratum]|nr:hypothetical protein F5B19DRAFT_468069 [Rostrohypoxylon terebratum]